MAEEVEEKKPAARVSNRAKVQPKAAEPKVEEKPVTKVEEPKSFRVKIVGPGALFVGGSVCTAGAEVEVSEADYKLSAEDQKKIYGRVFYEAL